MGRWEPDARGRLEQAALELYSEHGYEQTTVAEIAKRAGLTERTFFRYFADKREVLFWGSAALQERFIQTITASPASVPPLDAVGAALEAGAEMIQQRREHSLRRYAAIDANTELQERELIKLGTLATAVAETLRQRGVKEPAASLTAEAGIAVFKVAFERWIQPTNKRTFVYLVRNSLQELKVVAATGSD